MKIENSWMLDLNDLYKNYLKIADLLDYIDPKLKIDVRTISLHELIVKEVDRLDPNIIYVPKAMFKFKWNTYSIDIDALGSAEFENVYDIPLDFDASKVILECTKIMALKPNKVSVTFYFRAPRYTDFSPAIASRGNIQHKDIMSVRQLNDKMKDVFDLFDTFK